jgi:hypothetical protein
LRAVRVGAGVVAAGRRIPREAAALLPLPVLRPAVLRPAGLLLALPVLRPAGLLLALPVLRPAGLLLLRVPRLLLVAGLLRVTRLLRVPALVRKPPWFGKVLPGPPLRLRRLATAIKIEPRIVKISTEKMSPTIATTKIPSEPRAPTANLTPGSVSTQFTT